MNLWRLLCAGITLCTLCACAAPQERTSTTTKSPPVEKKAPPQLANLACAEVNSAEPLTILYQKESIYHSGAVLPDQEGLACLEALAAWLKSTPQKRWQITVAGEDGYGFDPLALAGKRQELLQRFFARKGVEQKNWGWLTVADQSTQLQLLQTKGSF